MKIQDRVKDIEDLGNPAKQLGMLVPKKHNGKHSRSQKLPQRGSDFTQFDNSFSYACPWDP